MSSARSIGSSHSTDTASSARLVLAMATRPPNWIISGSFSNCGAPPDIEIAVAIDTALSTAAIEVAANAANQSPGPGTPSVSCERVEHRHRDRRREREVRQVEGELQRRLAVHDEGGSRAEEHREEVVARREQEEPDDGRELAQREGVRLAPEVDVDDLELGGEEGRRHEVPRDGDGRRDRDLLTQEGDVQARGEAAEQRDEQGDPNRRRHAAQLPPASARQTPPGGVDDATLGAPGTRAPVRVEHLALRG